MPGAPGMAAVNVPRINPHFHFRFLPFIFILFPFIVSFIDYYGIIVVIPHYNSYHEQEKSYQIIGYWRWRSCIK